MSLTLRRAIEFHIEAHGSNVEQMARRSRASIALSESAVRGEAAVGRTVLCGGRAMNRTSLPLHRREFMSLLGGAAAIVILFIGC